MELTVGEGSRGAGTRLRDRTLPEKTLVLSLSRDGVERIPTGDDVLQSGDALVVMTSRAREKQVVSCLCS
jgi:Trk K+ transport system NAD-binding subunit